MKFLQRVGNYLTYTASGEAVKSYVPKHLPPNPAIEMETIYPLLEQATIALGRLEGISKILPSPALFLYMYIRKEAVLSSQIEGTQSSLSDLLSYENHEIPGVPEKDVIEVANYVAAMEHGLKRIRQDNFPLSLRLIREMHEILLSQTRGGLKQPGEFRRSQNWIGGTRPGNAIFVPPPPEKITELLKNLEEFLHDKTLNLPTLIKAALAHVQFETIHPFLDGNGRLGRLLIIFIICNDGIMQQPLLYLSLYFKKNRQSYYDHLQSVRETGDWEEWLKFFLKGVIETANQAFNTAHTISILFDEDRKKIETIGKSPASALIIYQYLQRHPVTDVKKVSEYCKITYPTAAKSLKYLVNLGIIKEVTGKSRNKIYSYQNYLNVLNKDTE